MPKQRFQFQNLSLRKIVYDNEDRDLIARLFRVQDVRLHYTLRDDHAANIDSFVAYLAAANENNTGIHLIIDDKTLTPVGFITAEPFRDDNTGTLGWNIGFAVLPSYRNNGIAAGAVGALKTILANYRIDEMVLDISMENKPAEAVAKACGFTQKKSPLGGLVGYLDQDHPEVGMRTKWISKVHVTDARGEAFNKACEAYRRKDYRTAIQLYYEAAEEKYTPGSPYTDAQVFSNLGMAFSSVKDYKKAYQYLTKAWSLGCQNDSVSRELQWLRTHAADVI